MDSRGLQHDDVLMPAGMRTSQHELLVTYQNQPDSCHSSVERIGSRAPMTASANPSGSLSCFSRIRSDRIFSWYICAMRVTSPDAVKRSSGTKGFSRLRAVGGMVPEINVRACTFSCPMFGSLTKGRVNCTPPTSRAGVVHWSIALL